MIDRSQHRASGERCRIAARRTCDRTEPRRERPGVIVALDKFHKRVAIQVNGRCAKRALLVACFFQCDGRLGAAGRRLVERRRRVRHFQRDDPDAVAVLTDEMRNGVIGTKRAGEHKPDVPLLQHV